MLDTESGRSRMYADDKRIGGYIIGEMHPPYTSESFAKALDEAEKTGADVIVVDSFSHEWSGIGGCVEQAENSKRASPSNWIAPKAAHRRLVNRILQTQVPVIFCLRTKPEFLTGKDANGKQTFGKGPEIAEQESRFIYEMTLAALLEYQTHQAFYSRLKNLPEPLRTILRDLASSGTDALAKHWKSLSKEWRLRLVAVKDECKAIAIEGDRLNQAALEGEPEPPTGDPFEDKPKLEAAN